MIKCVRVKNNGFLVTYRKAKQFYKTASAPETVYRFMTDKSVTCKTAINGDYVYKRGYNNAE